MPCTAVVCPATYQPPPARPWRRQRPTVFLGGGITGCPPWQDDAVTMLPDVVVALNPRQRDWRIDDPSASAAQIAWEVRYLTARVVLFWFCAGPVQPITWYELGKTAASGRRMAVGCDPGYSRRLDVVLQLRHARPEVAVRDSLRDVCADAAALALRRRCLSRSSPATPR